MVAEAQLEPGAEDVAHGGAEVRPAGRARHDVQAEGEAAPGELLDLHLQVVEVGAQRRPAVDDEEHVPEPVVGPGPAPPCPVGLDRVDALLAEVGLAPVDHTGDLGEDATDHVGLGAGAHTGDVREVGQGSERAAAEVEDEELRLLWRRHQRRAGHDGAQQRRLAAARAAHDRHVTGGPGQVDGQGVAALLTGTVHRAERHGEPAEGAPGRGVQAQRRVLDQVAEQPVERVGLLQRRQPDLVRGRATTGHPAYGEVEQRGVADRLRGDRLGGGVGLLLERADRGDGEGEDAADVAALVAAHRRAAAGRPGDVGGLEPLHRGRVGLEVAQTGHGRQLVGVGHPEHGPGLLGAEGAQPHAVGQVGLQAAQPALLQALAGEQQVDAQ